MLPARSYLSKAFAVVLSTLIISHCVCIGDLMLQIAPIEITHRQCRGQPATLTTYWPVWPGPADTWEQFHSSNSIML